MRYLVFVLIFCTASLPVVAGEKDIAACASKSDPLLRLECFDNLSREMGVEGGVKTSMKTSGNWIVMVDVSPIDDSTNVSAILISDNVVGTGWRADRASLVLRCSENKTNVFVNWNDYLGSDSIMVLERLDKRKAETHSWSLSTDNKSTFVKGGDIRYIKRLVGHEKLLLQLTPYNESPVMANFDLTGIEKAIEPLKKACHWVGQTKTVKTVSVASNSHYDAAKIKIGKYWIKPFSIKESMTVKVEVSLLKGGEVGAVKITDSSGNEMLDRSIEGAIYKASPLPIKVTGYMKKVQFTFTAK